MSSVVQFKFNLTLKYQFRIRNINYCTLHRIHHTVKYFNVKKSFVKMRQKIFGVGPEPSPGSSAIVPVCIV